MTDLEERTATDLRARLDTGVVIPAHPLALDDSGGLDLTAQRALTRYQLAALPAAEAAPGQRPIMVAGLVGDTAQAVREAQIARELGYEAALMSPWGMSERSEPILLERAQAVGEVLPTIGFYLQDSVGG